MVSGIIIAVYLSAHRACMAYKLSAPEACSVKVAVQVIYISILNLNVDCHVNCHQCNGPTSSSCTECKKGRYMLYSGVGTTFG